MSLTLGNFVLGLGIFTMVVVTIFLFEFRKIRSNLLAREKEMVRRMYQLSILRELGERIGYSLKIEQIVEVIAGSLRKLLEYATVSYMLLSPTPEGKTRITFNINLEKSISKEFIGQVKEIMLKSLNTLLNKEFSLEQIEETVSGTVTDPTNEAGVDSFFNVPIIIGGVPVGLLNIADTKTGQYGKKEIEILYTIVNQASSAVSKLEHVLKVEKGKLNSMVASMADGVLMIDPQKQLIVFNPAAQKMLQLKEEKPTIFDVLDALADQYDLRTKLEESISQDKLVVTPSVTLGPYFLQILISPVKDEEKNLLGTVVLFHDITKEKELEQMREDFTNMMVHELRSPLTGIKSLSTLLHDEKIKTDRKKYEEFINLITTNSQDMLALVNELLDVAKLEAGKFQLLKKRSNIHTVIEQRIESFKALANQDNISLSSWASDNVPKDLEFDEHKIIQVLNNLISNAIKFTAAGGKILVSVFVLAANKDLAREVVEQKLVWPGIKSGTSYKTDQLVVAVTDSGVGIPQSKLPDLFNKFVQLENAARSEKKGTGLGLVITKGIIEAHQGNLGVFSEEGEGTTFYFTLPINTQVI